MYKETQRGSDQLFTQREHSLAIHHFPIHLACILFTPNFSWVLHFSGADPGFFLGRGALVSCSTSTPINHIVFFFVQNTSCIRKPQVISRGGVHPLHPPPRSAPASCPKRNRRQQLCKILGS